LKKFTFNKQKISTRTNIDVIAGYKPIIKGTLFEDEEKNKVFINVDKFGREIQEAIFESIFWNFWN